MLAESAKLVHPPREFLCFYVALVAVGGWLCFRNFSEMFKKMHVTDNLLDFA